MSTFLGTLQSGKRPGRRRSHGDANLTPGASKFTVETQGVAAVAAAGTLTMDTKPTDLDTITVGSVTYTFLASFVDADGNVFIGSDVDESQANLTAAINASGGTPGTTHYTSQVANANVQNAAFGVSDSVFTAEAVGAAGNALVTTETFTAETNVFDAATLGTTVLGVTNVFEVVSFWVDGDSGTFTLSYGGQTTATIVYSANAALIDTRLTALSSIADVAVTGAGTKVSRFIVTFADPAGVATAITADTTLLKMAVVDADRVS